jgi:DNA-binding response OmpR family regulator
VDPARRIATRNGRCVRLTNKELAVLEVLLAAKGRVVSAEELRERVWDGRVDPFANSVRVTLMRLCKKLGRPPVIETLAGAGYRL